MKSAAWAHLFIFMVLFGYSSVNQRILANPLEVPKEVYLSSLCFLAAEIQVFAASLALWSLYIKALCMGALELSKGITVPEVEVTDMATILSTSNSPLTSFTNF